MEPNSPSDEYLESWRYVLEGDTDPGSPRSYRIASPADGSGDGEKPGFRVVTSRGWLEFRLADAPSVQPIVRGNHIEFRWGDTTLGIDLFHNQVKETILLGSSPSSSTITFEFTTSFQVASAEGGISIRDARGKEWLFVPDPVVVDSAGVEGSASFVVAEGSLSILIDPAFLDSAVYPVVVDPTVVVSNSPMDVVQTANARRVIGAANGRVGLLDGSAGMLKLRTAVAPYATWDSQTLVSDFVGDQASVAQAGDSAHVVYEGGSDGKITFFPLAYSGSAWSKGDSQVLVGSGGYEPSMVVDPEGRIWVFYEDTGSKKLRYRRSVDGGATWSAPGDVASLASNGSQPASSAPVVYGNHIGVAFNNGLGALQWRRTLRGTVSWSSGSATLGTVVTSNFSLVVTSQDQVFVGWADPDNRYRILTEGAWSGERVFDIADWPAPTSKVAMGPILTTDGTNVSALYTLDIGVAQKQLRRTILQQDYQTPIDMNPGQSVFGTVWDYVVAQNQWNQRSDQAKDTVEHNVPFAGNNGDELYLRGLAPFDVVTAIISQGARFRDNAWLEYGWDNPEVPDNGIKPAIQYWNGSTWVSVNDLNDTTFGFMNSGTVTYTKPGNWAERSVNGFYGYWLRIKRTATYAVQTPVATQITAVPTHASLTSSAGVGPDQKAQHFWTSARTLPAQLLTERGDITPPIGTIAINNGAQYTNAHSAELALTCSEGSACEMTTGVDTAPDTGFCNPGSSWVSLSSTKTVTFSLGDGLRLACARYRDAAGNWSPKLGSGIVLDTTPPTYSGFSISNPFFSPNGDGVKDTVQVAATVNDSLSGPSEWTATLLNSVADPVGSFSGVGPSLQITWDGLTDIGQAPDGAYNIRLWAVDQAGNASILQPSQLIVLDTVQPALSRPLPAPDGTVVDESPTISVYANDSLAGIEPGSAMADFDGVALNPSVLQGSSIGAGILYSFTRTGLGSGEHLVEFAVRDLAGNLSDPFQWFFTSAELRTDAPSEVAVASHAPAQLPTVSVPGDEITVHDVHLDLSPGRLELTHSGHAGAGTICGRIDLSRVRARFETLSGTHIERAPLTPSALPSYACANVLVGDADEVTSHFLPVGGRTVRLGSVRFPVPLGAKPDTPVTVHMLDVPPVEVAWNVTCRQVDALGDGAGLAWTSVCDPLPNYIPVDIGTEVNKFTASRMTVRQEAGYEPHSHSTHVSTWSPLPGGLARSGGQPDVSKLFTVPYGNLLPISPYAVADASNEVVLVRQLDGWLNSGDLVYEDSFHWNPDLVDADAHVYMSISSPQRIPTSTRYKLFNDLGAEVSQTEDVGEQPVVFQEQDGQWGTLIGFRSRYEEVADARHVTWGWMELDADSACISACSTTQQLFVSSGAVTFGDAPEGFVPASGTVNGSQSVRIFDCAKWRWNSCLDRPPLPVPERRFAYYVKPAYYAARSRPLNLCSGDDFESWTSNSNCNPFYTWGHRAEPGDGVAGVMHVFYVGAPCPNKRLTVLNHVEGCANPGTFSGIEQAMKAWIEGYHANSDHVGKTRLVVAPNNGNSLGFNDPGENFSHGADFYRSMRSLLDFARQRNAGSTAWVWISGGIDAEEVDGTGHRAAASTLPWIRGWNVTADALVPSEGQDVPSDSKLNLYMLGDFGSMNGSWNTPLNGWTGYDVWRASWGKGEPDYNENYAVPQIYRTNRPGIWALHRSGTPPEKLPISFSGIQAFCANHPTIPVPEQYPSSAAAYEAFREVNPSPLHYLVAVPEFNDNKCTKP